MQNSEFSTRIRSLYRSQTSPMFFAFKTAPLAPELQVSMCPSPHLWFCAFTTATLCPESIVIMGSQTSPVVLCMQISVINTRITSFYESQPTLAVFACKTAPFGSELQISMGPRLRLLICECKTACLDPE